ncbi:hypothetical protein JCM10207_005630 [Rhodosporidiobolus poonsookiae]
MAGVAGWELAAAVKDAGGMGFLGSGPITGESLTAEAEKARRALNLSDDEDLPLGVGVLTWYFESPQVPGSPSEVEEVGDFNLREILFSARARYIWLSFSIEGADGLAKWVERVRRIEREGPREGAQERERKGRVKVLVVVQDEEAGRKAREWDVDAVIAQGTEAGGHGATLSAGAPLLSLLRALSPLYSNTAPPFLLGAGGLSSPTSITAAFSFGAAAVVTGTALEVASESRLPAAQKALLVAAEGDATLKGAVFDLARDGRNRWPEGVHGRALRNVTSAEEGEAEAMAERYRRAVEEKDTERIITWAGVVRFLDSPLFSLVAGANVKDVKAIRPAKDIVRELMGL